MRPCAVTSVEETERVADKVRAMGSFRSLVHTADISPEMADVRRVLEVDLQDSVPMTDAVFPLVGPGSSAILIGPIAGYSDVDPAVESLLDDPMAEGFVDEVERVLGGSFDSSTAYVLAKRGVVRLVERLAAPWGQRGDGPSPLRPASSRRRWDAWSSSASQSYRR